MAIAHRHACPVAKPAQLLSVRYVKHQRRGQAPGGQRIAAAGPAASAFRLAPLDDDVLQVPRLKPYGALLQESIADTLLQQRRLQVKYLRRVKRTDWQRQGSVRVRCWYMVMVGIWMPSSKIYAKSAGSSFGVLFI